MSTNLHSNLFGQVDRTEDPRFFIRFMEEAQKPEGIRAAKRIMSERIGLVAVDSVLDVGCGPGDDLFDIVRLVGPTGRLVGVDASETMIAEARKRASQLNVPVTFEVGDVHALRFPDGAFRVCRAQRLLEHLPDAGRPLAELVRVTSPGGLIVVYDFDFDTLIIDHPDKETTRTIVRSYCDSIRNGWIGRQLPRLFKQHHPDIRYFDPVQVFVHYAMAELFLGSHLALLCREETLSADQIQHWWQHLQDAERQGMLLISFTSFVIVGAKAA